MIKKILFPLACVACLLTSCLEEVGYYGETGEFGCYVTIDTNQESIYDNTQSVKLKADFMRDFTDLTNLKNPEQLADFGLENAKRAFVIIRYSGSITSPWVFTLLKKSSDIPPMLTHPIPTLPINKKEVTGNQQHIEGLQSYYGNYIWVADGYLNIIPTIRSGEPGNYYLTPDTVKGDTLFFNLDAVYNKGNKPYYDELQCFDLRTIADSLDADENIRHKMNDAYRAIKDLDSVRIAITASYATKSDVTRNDTIVRKTLPHTTNYFKDYFLEDEL